MDKNLHTGVLGAAPLPEPETSPSSLGHDGLADLEAIRLDDADRFAASAEAGRAISWSHFFPYLFFSGKPDPRHRLLHEFVDGSVLVYRLETRKGKQRLSLLLAPFPFSPAALAQAKQRMHAFNGKGQARIVRLQEHEALTAARYGFEIVRHSDEYLYDAEAVAKIEGSAFATVRRKIARYTGDDVIVREYRAADAPACRFLLDAWRADLRTTGVKIGPYHRYSRLCLDEYAVFARERLVGQVIEVAGEIGAFSFGGGITATHASIFITVADRRHPGLAYFQRKCLIDGLSGFRFFNDAHDSKRPGLAQMKRSFRPAMMHSLFGARRG